jgi:hypothetical protein
MDKILDGFGFDMVWKGVNVHDSGERVEYGRLARKR